MIKYENRLGVIEVSPEYFANLVGNAAQSCFGVAGMMTHGASQGIRAAVSNKNFPSKGVIVRGENDSLVIDLHIIVTYGINISAIVDSIVHKVTYTVQQSTGFKVKKVNVFVDGMKA